MKITRKVKMLTNSKRAEFHIASSSLVNCASFWSGGSINNFSVVNIRSNQSKVPPAGTFPNFNATYELKDGEIVVKTGTFAGKSITPFIFHRGDNKEEVFKYLEIPLEKS